MSRYNDTIKFEDLKKYNNLLKFKKTDEFINYLNSFSGDNIFFKFLEIVKIWERDVSQTFEFQIDGKTIKVQLSYFISELEKFNNSSFLDDLVGNVDGVEVGIGIPDRFSDLFPIYQVIKSIKFLDVDIVTSNYDDIDKKRIIDGLPAKYFNDISKSVYPNMKIFEINNPSLKSFKINFYSIEPLIFIKDMFLSFNEYYFQDNIYYLSSKLGYYGVVNSTPSELEYYIDKLSDESKDDSGQLPKIS